MERIKSTGAGAVELFESVIFQYFIPRPR